MTARLLLLGICFTTTLAFAVAPPARPLRESELADLVEQLGDRDYHTRDLAESRLRASGISALPLLKKALGHSDQEIRRRARRIIPGLEHAILVAPKRITMTVENKTLDEVLAELAKISGYKITPVGNAGVAIWGQVPPRAVAAKAPEKEQRLSYSFLNEPFWNVLDRICRDNDLHVQQTWGDDYIRLARGRGKSPHSGIDGAFRYTANNLQLLRNVDLSHPSGEESSESLTFSFSVHAEPKLPFLNMGEVRIDSAYDNEKNPMTISSQNNDVMDGFGGIRFRSSRYYGGGQKQTMMQGSFNLERISQRASRIKEIRGAIPVTLLVEQKPVVLTDKLMESKGRKTTVGDLDFTIEEVKKLPNNQYSIRFSAANKGNPNDYGWTNSIYQRIELQDAAGNKFQNYGSNWNSGGPGGMTLTMTYGSPGGLAKSSEPTKFVFMHWVTKQHEINFVFRDIPLP